MNNSLRPLPLSDVMQIVDRRRRRRAKARAAAGSAAAVAGFGVAGIVGVYVSGDRLAAGPAAPSSLAPSVEPSPDPTVEPTVDAFPEPSAPGTMPAPGLPQPSGAPVDASPLEAFVAAGYTYTDAIAIALSWDMTGDPYEVKVTAGQLLAEGIALVDAPRSNPSSDDGLTEADLADWFYSDGYTPSDALTLAREWGTSPSAAAARAGSELKVVGALPYVDPPAAESGSSLAAYFAFGCGVADAEILAEFWGLGSSSDAISQAKVRANDLLVAGEPLPVTTPPLSC